MGKAAQARSGMGPLVLDQLKRDLATQKLVLSKLGHPSVQIIDAARGWNLDVVAGQFPEEIRGLQKIVGAAQRFA